MGLDRAASSRALLWRSAPCRTLTTAASLLDSTQDDFQTSITKPVRRSGIGLHSGKEASVTIFPSQAGKGRIFTFGSGYGIVQVPAYADFVVDSKLSTCVGRGSVQVRTVEHLLSALEGLGVDNCRIHLEGNNEVPLLDGSALQWIEAIDETGISVAKNEHGSLVTKKRYKLKEPVHVSNEDSFVVAFPSQNTKLTYGIDFPKHSAIGKQWFTCSLDPSSFRKEIAPARTFGLYEQIESLRAAGLIKGGSLENALVCSENGWLNPLRFPDEPCRHKLLDFLGDLSLCSQGGHPGLPIAHILAYKASHALHVKFCKALLELMKTEDWNREVQGGYGAGYYAFFARFEHVGTQKEAESSLDNIAYRVRQRNKPKKVPIPPHLSAPQGELNKQVVNQIVEVLNDTVYIEDIPEKLCKFKGKVVARDVAMILKLVRDMRLAFGFFEWTREQEGLVLNLDVFLTMVHRLLAARKWENLNKAVDLMHEKSFYLDFGLFEAVIKEASDAQQAEVCEKWYTLMREINVNPNVFIYNLMIRVYSREGRHFDALKIFQDMADNKVKPTVVTYSQLFSVCRDVGDTKIAKVLLTKMKIQGIKPDRISYTTLMNFYAKAGQPEEAEALFQEMRTRKIEPDVLVYNCLLESYIKADRFEQAKSVFHDRFLASGMTPNEATYVIMLGLYCKACLYDEAFELLKTVDHDTVKLGEQFFITLIKVFFKAERWDDTITVFKEMDKSSCRIRGSIYVLLLEVCYKAGYYESCVEFFAAVLDKGINRTPGVYETMIRAYNRMDKAAEVVEVFNYMRDMLCPFTSEVYDLLHEIFTRTRNTEMLEVLEDIKKAVRIVLSSQKKPLRICATWRRNMWGVPGYGGADSLSASPFFYRSLRVF